MAMQTASPAQINVTPLIDVLLVLLIIFMAISPSHSVGLEAKVPQPAPKATVQEAANDQLVIAVRHDGALFLNTKSMSRNLLERTLREALALRPDRPVFVDGAKDLEYREVAAVLDLARAAGATRIGLLTSRATG